jgi:hypothetical protein
MLNTSKFCPAVKSRMVQITYLALSVFSPIDDIAACRVVNYYHVFWIKGNHLVVLKVSFHVPEMYPLPGEQFLYLALEMKLAPARALYVTPVSHDVSQPGGVLLWQLNYYLGAPPYFTLPTRHPSELVLPVHSFDVVKIGKGHLCGLSYFLALIFQGALQSLS